MAKVRVIGSSIVFKCPGCGHTHDINNTWQFNGDTERPTIKPSILIRSGHYARQFVPGKDRCWCNHNAEHPEKEPSFICTVCHSYITDGRIQYLNDCTHAMAGQTVELPNEEDWYNAQPKN